MHQVLRSVRAVSTRQRVPISQYRRVTSSTAQSDSVTPLIGPFGEGRVGMIGFGKIGRAMSHNFLSSGVKIVGFDCDPSAIDPLIAEYPSDSIIKAPSIEAVAQECNGLVLSVLPNDSALSSVSEELCKYPSSVRIHVSSGTVHPNMAETVALKHREQGQHYIAAPVFARPDGMRQGQSVIPVSGHSESIEDYVKPLLSLTSTRIEVFGDENNVSAANVVKLTGNHLIACAIQAMSEGMALCEKSGVDPKSAMDLLNSTIFDCLIYKGYGFRVSRKDHVPYEDAHFALDLGLKDVSLVVDSGEKKGVDMPAAKVVQNQLQSATDKGRGSLDWSALSLETFENADIDVSDVVRKCKTYPE